VKPADDPYGNCYRSNRQEDRAMKIAQAITARIHVPRMMLEFSFRLKDMPVQIEVHPLTYESDAFHP